MAQFLVDVVLRATDLALLGVALSLMYALIKFPNVAIVQYATLGAFGAMYLEAMQTPLWLAALLASGLVAVLAVLLHKLVFERLLRVGAAFALIGSLAVGMLISAVLLVVAGAPSRRYALAVKSPLTVMGIVVTENQLYSIAITTLALVALGLLLYRTGLGRSIRAAASNEVLATATGIDTKGVTNTVVAMGGGLAALGGICLGIKGEINIQMGQDVLLSVFAVAILGGLGNAMGAVLGAFVIAVAETVVISVNYGPVTGQMTTYLPAAYATAASFLLLVVALLWRPHGLFDFEARRV